MCFVHQLFLIMCLLIQADTRKRRTNIFLFLIKLKISLIKTRPFSLYTRDVSKKERPTKYEDKY